jgi:hypothetical protein
VICYHRAWPGIRVDAPCSVRLFFLAEGGGLSAEQQGLWRDGRVGRRRLIRNQVYGLPYRGFESLSLRYSRRKPFGEMTERPKVHDWKSCVPQGTEGSNPSLSAGIDYARALQYARVSYGSG